MVVHACNPSYLGGRNEKIMVQNQSGQIDLETTSQPIKAGHDGAHLSSQLHRKSKQENCGPG
jgi:hypothetical protein